MRGLSKKRFNKREGYHGRGLIKERVIMGEV